MTTLREAAQQALEALETMTQHFGFARLGSSSLADTMKRGDAHVAMNNLRAALAEPQEPVQEPGFWGRVAARQASRIKQLETAAQQAGVMLKTGMPEYNTDDVLEVLEAALEALEAVTTARCGGDDGMDISPINAAYDKAESAREALKAALAEPEYPLGQASTDVGVPVYVLKKAEPPCNPSCAPGYCYCDGIKEGT